MAAPGRRIDHDRASFFKPQEGRVTKAKGKARGRTYTHLNTEAVKAQFKRDTLSIQERLSAVVTSEIEKTSSTDTLSKTLGDVEQLISQTLSHPAEESNPPLSRMQDQGASSSISRMVAQELSSLQQDIRSSSLTQAFDIALQSSTDRPLSVSQREDALIHELLMRDPSRYEPGYNNVNTLEAFGSQFFNNILVGLNSQNLELQSQVMVFLDKQYSNQVGQMQVLQQLLSTEVRFRSERGDALDPARRALSPYVDAVQCFIERCSKNPASLSLLKTLIESEFEKLKIALNSSDINQESIKAYLSSLELLLMPLALATAEEDSSKATLILNHFLSKIHPLNYQQLAIALADMSEDTKEQFLIELGALTEAILDCLQMKLELHEELQSMIAKVKNYTDSTAAASSSST